MKYFKILKYRKLDHPREAFLVFLWSAHVTLMSILYIALRIQNQSFHTALFNLGFGCGMLYQSYMCYRFHNIKKMFKELEEHARKIIADTRTLLDAENIINEREEKGF